MRLYFVYLRFSRKGDISGFLASISQHFTVFWKFLSCIVQFYSKILYCIPILLKKIAVGGLLWSSFANDCLRVLNFFEKVQLYPIDLKNHFRLGGQLQCLLTKDLHMKHHMKKHLQNINRRKRNTFHT